RCVVTALLGAMSATLSFACSSIPDVAFVRASDSGVQEDSASDGGAPGGDASVADSTSGVGARPPTRPSKAAPSLACCRSQICSGDCPQQGNKQNDRRDDCVNHGCPATNVCCRNNGAFVACVPVGTPCQ